VFERFATFKKRKPADGERFVVGKKPIIFMFLAPLIYGMVVFLLAANNIPGGLGNIGGDRSEETFETIRRYVFFLPLIGIPFMPKALRYCSSMDEKATLMKLYLVCSLIMVGFCVCYLYFIVPFMPRF
jgi:hypothetical protein